MMAAYSSRETKKEHSELRAQQERVVRGSAVGAAGKKQQRYRPVASEEAGNLAPPDEGSEVDGGESPRESAASRLGVPLAALAIAALILFSQFQLAFETRYQYDYQIENVVESGDGETYAYNMWGGVRQVTCGAACGRSSLTEQLGGGGSQRYHKRPPSERDISDRITELYRVRALLIE